MLKKINPGVRIMMGGGIICLSAAFNSDFTLFSPGIRIVFGIGIIVYGFFKKKSHDKKDNEL
jgi:hypothetical protein